MTCLTSYFMMSKNFEVDPIDIRDVSEHLLGNKNKRDGIRKKEHMLRTSLGYVNESATMFEFLMLYIKIWKIACHEKVLEKFGATYEEVYEYLSDIESTVYDILKSVLIDTSTLRYKGSLIVAALFTVSIDVQTRVQFLPNFK